MVRSSLGGALSKHTIWFKRHTEEMHRREGRKKKKMGLMWQLVVGV